MLELIKKIWNDPVISKIIAAGLITVITTVWLIVRSYLKNTPLRKKEKNLGNNSKLLIFLSTGGTCRDPMAKVITQKILEERKINIKLDIRGMAVIETSDLKVTYAARYTIKSIYGADLLAKHKCEKISKETFERADLILVMSSEVFKQLKLRFPDQDYSKVYLFKEFFGLNGDIVNPYPDGRDTTTLKRYLNCAEELRNILSANLDILINALSV